MKHIAVIMLIILILAAGCEEKHNEIKVTKSQGYQRTAEPTNYRSDPAKQDAPEDNEPEAISVDEQDENIAPRPPRIEIISDPFCGDDICQDSEDCSCDDCPCQSPYECHNGECIEPECGSNSECPDGDACQIGTCFFAGHPNSYCGIKDLTVCRDDDDCCPKNCDGTEDNDCNTECGNGKCEYDEDGQDCPEDCGNEYCGDGQCSGDEDGANCPKDCGYICGNGQCEDGEDSDNCSKDCCEPDQWYAEDEDCECAPGYSKDTQNDGFECVE